MFLFFVYFFDWIIYGQSKFTLVSEPVKKKGESRPIPADEQTMCGAQDLNKRIKVKLDDSYLVVDTTAITYETHSELSSTLCLEACSKLVLENNTSSEKSIRSIRLGQKCILLERPSTQLPTISDHTRKPSITVILKSFQRILTITVGGMVLIGMALMLTQMSYKTQLSSHSMEINNTTDLSPNLNTSSNLLSPPTSSDVSNGLPQLHNHDHLLILHQKLTYQFVVNLRQNRTSRQNWFRREPGLSVANSCSINFKGLMYLYGAYDKRQILKLDWCKDSSSDLELGHTKFMRVGELQFDFEGGTCATNGADVVICFGSIGSRTCYRSDTPTSTTDWWTWFEPVAKSPHNHKLSLITSSHGEH